MSTIKSSTTTTTAYSVTADTTGTLVLQTGATPTTAVTIGSDQSVTFAGAVSLSGNQTTTGNLTVNGNTTLGDASTDTVLITGAPSIGGAGLGMGMGFRNRIINGAMVIDQRNAGAIVTSTTGIYTLDRWYCLNSVTSKYTVQQNAGSITPPAGFTNYLGVTSSAATSVGSTDYYVLRQAIEGFNCADFAWGTASAATVTLSFKVYSSLTGTFGGAVQNNTSARSYPFSYTISSANTWTTVSVTIPGDTSGTWQTGNLTGIFVYFGLGVGSTYSGTAGSWSGSNFISATGATSVVGTNTATFYITGVQLEKGSTATSFDYRPYGTELALCQRYYWKFSTYLQAVASGACVNTTNTNQYLKYPVAMRAAPTITQSSTYVNIGTASVAVTSISTIYAGNDSALVTPATASGLVGALPAIWLINLGYVDGSSEL